MINLQEAFTKLNMFESEEFDIQDEKSREAMEDFLSDDESVEANDVDIIDPQAENEFDLEDSYVGKIVVQCPVCKSLLFRLPEEMEEKKDEEETCPYCYSVEVMEPIGKIVGLDEEEPIENGEEPIEKATTDDVEPVEECALHEDLENVTIETENEVINVSAEDKNECPECDDAEQAEVIAPLNDVESEEEEEEGEEDNEEENEDEITDFDEESFDDMAESFFRENYKNVKSFRATKGYDKGNHMVIEGILTLTNGKKKLTEFRVRPGKFRANGTATCLIENLQLNKKKIVNVRLGRTMTEGKRRSKRPVKK